MADVPSPTMPDMTLGGEMQDSAEFLGVVTVDEWVQNKEGNWQWHLCVKPVDFDLQGETGAFHTWYKHSTRRQSKIGLAREAMLTLPDVFPAEEKIGRGQLQGRVAWWTRRNLEFGTDKSTGEKFIAEDVLIPLRAATAEEQARGKSKAGGAPSGAVAPVPPAADTSELDDATLNAVLELLDGKTKSEIQFAVARNKSLSREVKQAILGGSMQASLEEAGLVTVIDGKVTRAAAA